MAEQLICTLFETSDSENFVVRFRNLGSTILEDHPASLMKDLRNIGDSLVQGLNFSTGQFNEAFQKKQLDYVREKTRKLTVTRSSMHKLTNLASQKTEWSDES